MKINRYSAVAFAAVLASSQEVFAQDAPVISGGDTAWVLVSSALVLLMTPGLAFFYAGMVRSKNAVAMLMKNFIALAVITVVWVVAGYSLAFAPTINGDLPPI